MLPRPVGVELRGFGWRPLGRRRPVVRGVDLDVLPGERILLAGPSGAGKSTLLLALAGVLETLGEGEQSGELLVDGADPRHQRPAAGLLLQNAADGLVADRVGRDVAFGPENLGMPRDEIWTRVDAALEAVGFPYGRNHPTAALSGGELQRLALAGVLALAPGLLLLDEPASMLDDESATVVRDAITQTVSRTGATMLLVEHRLEPWLPHVDRVVVLGRHGQVVQSGDPTQVINRHGRALAEAGVWVPGFSAPAPRQIAEELTRPQLAVPTGSAVVAAHQLDVDLRTRSLRSRLSVPALRDVDATLTGGAAVAFTGPSGAGKSTLVAVLAGLLAPDQGAVTAGSALSSGLHGPPHRWRSPDLARRIAWVPQHPEHGLITRRVADEVAVTGRRLGVHVDVDAVLAAFDLVSLAEVNPYRLSGGEQRRLALAAALAHRPAVALLDEPTVGLDRLTWSAVTGWLETAAGAGAAIGFATHDAGLIAMADAQVRLRAGRCVSSAA